MQLETRWVDNLALVNRLAARAHSRSCFPHIFEKSDFVQEAAVCFIKHHHLYIPEEGPFSHYIAVIVRRRFLNILRSQWLQRRLFVYLEDEKIEPASWDAVSLSLIAERLSPVAQSVFWCFLDPEEDFIEFMIIRRVRYLSRKLVAAYFQISPRKVSKALEEIKQVIRETA
jgi:DNA-directed RNA polymerase specialized sigma24 family protein